MRPLHRQRRAEDATRLVPVLGQQGNRPCGKWLQLKSLGGQQRHVRRLQEGENGARDVVGNLAGVEERAQDLPGAGRARMLDVHSRVGMPRCAHAKQLEGAGRGA